MSVYGSAYETVVCVSARQFVAAEILTLAAAEFSQLEFLVAPSVARNLGSKFCCAF